MGKRSLLLFSLISSSMVEIKTLKIKADSRSIILFEKFGFGPRGFVNITVSNVTFSSTLASPNAALFGFFLLSDESLIQATYESQQYQEQNSNPNPNPNPGCVLSSPYVRLLFKFNEHEAPNYNSFTNYFPITHPDEYSLFFANCNPKTQVSMVVRTAMYNVRPDGSPDYLSVNQSPVPSLYFVPRCTAVS